ncbi:hypothetical protein DSLASN_07830 [Desulfoluna limicola]|uniref:Uncharacterized protein n=1 Tax=Desulfoluna limicola TaxID=2810562 RepID=A0ABM7PD35_9BACT|nr:hypothetical protein DSLASN_07830 [Desulfoluna limicola]
MPRMHPLPCPLKFKLMIGQPETAIKIIRTQNNYYTCALSVRQDEIKSIGTESEEAFVPAAPMTLFYA